MLTFISGKVTRIGARYKPVVGLALWSEGKFE